MSVEIEGPSDANHEKHTDRMTAGLKLFSWREGEWWCCSLGVGLGVRTPTVYSRVSRERAEAYALTMFVQNLANS